MPHSFSKAFSLIEILIALLILAILAILIIPRFLSIRRNALIRTAVGQTALLQKAISSWASSPALSSTASVSAVSQNFGDSPTSNFIGASTYSEMKTYLDAAFISGRIFEDNGGDSYLYTKQMNDLTGNVCPAATVTINATDYSVAPISDMTHAYVRIYWPTTNRLLCSPVAVLFIPDAN